MSRHTAVVTRGTTAADPQCGDSAGDRGAVQGGATGAMRVFTDDLDTLVRELSCLAARPPGYPRRSLAEGRASPSSRRRRLLLPGHPRSRCCYCTDTWTPRRRGRRWPRGCTPRDSATSTPLGYDSLATGVPAQAVASRRRTYGHHRDRAAVVMPAPHRSLEQDCRDRPDVARESGSDFNPSVISTCLTSGQSRPTAVELI
jgi:hypothetical protein